MEAVEPKTEEEAAPEDVAKEPTTETPRTANKKVIAVVEEIVKAFAEKKTLEELFFGPGAGLLEIREIRNIVKTTGLRMDQRQHEGKSYIAIFNRHSPQEMVECLKKCGGRSGKYYLSLRSELPKHSEIEEELEKQKKSALAASSSFGQGKGSGAATGAGAGVDKSAP